MRLPSIQIKPDVPTVVEEIERVWFRFSPFHIKAETHWHPQMDMYIYQLEAEICASMNMATYTFPG